MNNSLDNTTYLCKDDFEQRIMSGDLVGYNLCLPSVPFDLLQVYALRHSINEASYLSRKFRYLTYTPSKNTDVFGVVNDNSMSTLILQELDTKDSGKIPVIFGASTIFPAMQDEILTYAKEFIEASDEMRVVDEGHQELIISDLKNYNTPNRVVRAMRKGSGLMLTRIAATGNLYNLYANYPYAKLADIHTQLYFGGVIANSTSDEEVQRYEDLYQRCHNHADYLSSLAMIYTADNAEDAGDEYRLYAIQHDGRFLGHAQVQCRNGVFYWVNTNRLRLPSLQTELGFNINNVIIGALIEEAKRTEGVHTFNLGMCKMYPYKHIFTDQTVWVKGIRYV